MVDTATYINAFIGLCGTAVAWYTAYGNNQDKKAQRKHELDLKERDAQLDEKAKLLTYEMEERETRRIALRELLSKESDIRFRLTKVLHNKTFSTFSDIGLELGNVRTSMKHMFYSLNNNAFYFDKSLALYFDELDKKLSPILHDVDMQLRRRQLDDARLSEHLQTIDPILSNVRNSLDYHLRKTLTVESLV